MGNKPIRIVCGKRVIWHYAHLPLFWRAWWWVVLRIRKR